MDMPKSDSLLTDKKTFFVVIVVCAIILSSVVMFRFSDDLFPDRPPGVGKIGSDHAHAKILVSLDERFLNLNVKDYPEYAHLDYYVALDDRNFVHRTATGVTLGMFFQTMGIEFTDECFILTGDITDTDGIPFENKEFCNNDEKQLKVYVTTKLIDEKSDYVFNQGEIILVAYDDINTKVRDYPSMLPSELRKNNPEPEETIVIENP